jgi:hypothetical protein
VSPENGPDVVERAARALGFPLDTVFRLRVPEGNPHQLAAPPARARPGLARAGLSSGETPPRTRGVSAFVTAHFVERRHGGTEMSDSAPHRGSGAAGVQQ